MSCPPGKGDMSDLTLNHTVLTPPPKSEAAKSMPTERSPSGRDASERSRPAPAYSRAPEYAQSVSGPAPAPIARVGHLKVPRTSVELDYGLDLVLLDVCLQEGSSRTPGGACSNKCP